MAIAELRKKLSAPHKERVKWYTVQILLARSLIKGILLKAKAGNAGRPFFVPEPEELVSETIVRVLDQKKRYQWDGLSPETFDEFFAGCIRTTADYFWSKARGHRNQNVLLRQSIVPPTVAELADAKHRNLEDRDSKAALAAAIAKTRIRGVTLRYAQNLPSYVEQGSATLEIAADLGVEKSTVPSIRARLHRLFDEPDQS